jgi:hypothetical protein
VEEIAPEDLPDALAEPAFAGAVLVDEEQDEADGRWQAEVARNCSDLRLERR